MTLTDGSLARFRVRRVAQYANADFPAQRVDAGCPGRSMLRPVTRGGRYDPDLGGYQTTVVVFADRVASNAR